MRDYVRSFAAGLLGGALAGAVIGCGEAALVVATTAAPEEYWLFPFGILYYGLLGSLCGGPIGLLASLLGGGDSRAVALGCGAAGAFLPLGLMVSRYHVIQRVFHEELVTFSATGLAVHAALLAAAIAVSLAVFFLGRAIGRLRRGMVAAAAVLLACLLVSGAMAAATSTRSEGRVARAADAESGSNVILIIADTLRDDALTARLQRDPAASGMARLAADGVRFENAYAQSSWTRPSVATIMTSLYPTAHGATHKMDPLPDDVTTLAEALRDRGYWTAGVVSNINVAPIFNFQQGFGEYTYLEPDFYFGASDSATRLAIYKGLRVARERLLGSYIYFNNYYQDAEILGRAVAEWLEQEPPQPFFLLIHYMDTHDPYFEIPYDGRGVARVNNPNPAAARAAGLRKLYDENVGYLDAHLAKLLAQLQERGLYEKSIVALVADHGEEFQEHGGWWHGTTLYEEQLRVPLVIKRAGESTPGTTEKIAARTLDVAPTLMVAAGVAVPEEFTGRDLFAQEANDGEPMFAEEELEGNVLASLRLGHWKIIAANPGNPRGLQPVELYHLGDDPLEKRNLAADQPQEAARMLALLEKHRALALR
jgi:arylsulfatase A-like enzyme